jgi:hypothetical protein
MDGSKLFFKIKMTNTPQALKSQRDKHQPQPGEISFKEWRMNEAARLGVMPMTIFRWIKLGSVKLKTRRKIPGHHSVISANERIDRAGPPQNSIQLKAWIFEEAERENKSASAIWMRFYRGKYPELELLRINRCVVFVKQ